MEKSVALIALTFSSICCLINIRPATVQSTDTPTLMILEDSVRSTTLQSTHNGSVWTISSGNPGTYLSAVAYQAFGQVTIGNFQEITLVFDSTYSIGTLTGIGSDSNGNKVPVGVEYELISQSSGTNIYRANKVDTCAGTPCSCCEFIKRDDGTVKGCKCVFDDNDCRDIGSTPNGCNHTVSQ